MTGATDPGFYDLIPIRFQQLVAAMLRGDFTKDDAGKIAGGNYMRIFRAAVG